MKIIIYENVPRWYALLWNQKDPSITVAVHRDLAGTIEPVPNTAPIVEVMSKSFEFDRFEGSLEKNFGFDDALSRSEESELVNFTAKLPVVFKYLEEPCRECKGTGGDKYREDRECSLCWGTGKEHDYQWHEAYAISASFNLLLGLASYADIETSSKLPQLLTVRLVTEHGQHGGSLDGDYSIPLVQWLSKRVGQTIPEMVEAMKEAYQRMLPTTLSMSGRFRASVDYEGGWLNVDCPGEACGLNPAHGSLSLPEDGKRGYEFYCHNVDSPAQQLTLLAGLAALHEAVDRDLQGL